MLLAGNSNWLESIKDLLLCGSLVMLLEPQRGAGSRGYGAFSRQHGDAFQYDVLTRLLVPGKHYLSLPLPALDKPLEHERDAHPSQAYEKTRSARMKRAVCDTLTAALDWAEANPAAAQEIASVGRAFVRDTLTMANVYEYMAAVVKRSAALIDYSPAQAMNAHRLVRGKAGQLVPFNSSNITQVPVDADDFAAMLRNDSAMYPITAHIDAVDWRAVVLDYNYSRMGVGFAQSARALEDAVLQMRRAAATTSRA